MSLVWCLYVRLVLMCSSIIVSCFFFSVVVLFVVNGLCTFVSGGLC